MITLPQRPTFVSLTNLPLLQSAMSHEDNQDREQDVRERIVSLIQATGQARKERLREEELKELKTAASRLDQMLQAAADEDRQTLQSAAARLDQLLADLGSGKDVTHNLKRKRVSRRTEE